MAVERVIALGPIRSQHGNREKDDEFDYDMRSDPLDLKKLGLVAPVAPKETPAETGDKPGGGKK